MGCNQICTSITGTQSGTAGWQWVTTGPVLICLNNIQYVRQYTIHVNQCHSRCNMVKMRHKDSLMMLMATFVTMSKTEQYEN